MRFASPRMWKIGRATPSAPMPTGISPTGGSRRRTASGWSEGLFTRTCFDVAALTWESGNFIETPHTLGRLSTAWTSISIGRWTLFGVERRGGGPVHIAYSLPCGSSSQRRVPMTHCYINIWVRRCPTLAEVYGRSRVRRPWLDIIIGGQSISRGLINNIRIQISHPTPPRYFKYR